MFTTIDHNVRKKFDLTLNEYAICDSIYHLSRKGFCNASKEYLGEFIGISRKQVHIIINKLLDKGLLNKNKNMVYTSDVWNNAILQLHTVTKSDTECNQKLHDTVTKSYTECNQKLHNNNNINNNNNNNNKAKKSPYCVEYYNNVDNMFQTHNSLYYRDGKESKNISNICKRLDENKFIELFNKFRKIITKDKGCFWQEQPMTPSVFYSLISRIEVYKFDKQEKKSIYRDL